MIDTIPNPLQDKGVNEDIDRKIYEVMSYPIRVRALNEFQDEIRRRLELIAKWAYVEGFRMGWKIHEVRSKK